LIPEELTPLDARAGRPAAMAELIVELRRLSFDQVRCVGVEAAAEMR
jgi:hypothetical protein